MNIDSLLVDRVFEPFAHFVQKLVGWTCFSLSRATIALYCVFIIVALFQKLADNFDFVFSVLFALPQFILSYRIEEKCNGNSSKGFKNPERIESVTDRYRFLKVLLIVSFFVLRHHYELIGMEIMLAGLTISSYFMACTPLPPGKSKVRKLWEKLKEKLICNEGDLAPEPA